VRENAACVASELYCYRLHRVSLSFASFTFSLCSSHSCSLYDARSGIDRLPLLFHSAGLTPVRFMTHGQV
jgi:hypothetical protein